MLAMAPRPGQQHLDLRSLERVGPEIFIARPEKREVYVYPCVTHNCPLREDGSIREAQTNAFFCHLKGPRKQHVERFMAARFGL